MKFSLVSSVLLSLNYLDFDGIIPGPCFRFHFMQIKVDFSYPLYSTEALNYHFKVFSLGIKKFLDPWVGVLEITCALVLP